MTLILDSGGLLAALDYMIPRDYGREGQLAFLSEVKRGAYGLEPLST